MQNYQQVIENLEIQSRLYENFNLMRSRLTTSKLKTIVLVSLISFTSLLVRQTLQVQHSCNPMIHWSGELPAECQVVVENGLDNFNDFSSPTKPESETPKQPQIIQKTEVYGPPNISSELSKPDTPAEVVHQNSDLVGVGAGAAAGSVVAGVAMGAFSMTPPGAVLIGIAVMVGVWQTIKKAF